MSMHTKESAEMVKVGGVGLLGVLTSISLSDVATIMPIAVGGATLIYILAKTYFLFRNHGKPADD